MISSDQSFSHFVPSPFSGAFKIHLSGHKIVRSHSLIWSDSTRSGGTVDGIHLTKSDVNLTCEKGWGWGAVYQPTHRTNSSTSIGTGMDALKSLDKQLLGHKNEGTKKIFGQHNSDGKNGMI